MSPRIPLNCVESDGNIVSRAFKTWTKGWLCFDDYKLYKDLIRGDIYFLESGQFRFELSDLGPKKKFFFKFFINLICS